MEPVGGRFSSQMSTCKSWDHTDIRNVESDMGPWKSQAVLPEKPSFCNSILTPPRFLKILIRKYMIIKIISLIISKLQLVQFWFFMILPFYISTTAPLPSGRPSVHCRCLQPCWIAIVEGKLPEECQVQDYLSQVPDPPRPKPGEMTWGPAMSMISTFKDGGMITNSTGIHNRFNPR